MLSPEAISFLVILVLITTYFSPVSSKFKISFFVIIFLESVAIISVFVDIGPGPDKYPLRAILPVTFLSLFLSYRTISLDTKEIDGSYSTIPLSKVIGFFLIVITILLEWFLFDKSFSSNSISIILFGIFIFLFEYIPQKFSDYRKMVLYFFILYITLFPLLSVIIQIFTGTVGKESSDIYRDEIVHLFLGKPLINFLNLLGYNFWSIGDTIFYPDLERGLISSVSISKGCSGLDSIIIFYCAFFSYVLVEYKVLDYNTIILLFTGTILCYLANLLRMAIIILSGHYYGSEALDWSHANVGWIIFTSWVFLFWQLMETFLQNKYNEKAS